MQFIADDFTSIRQEMERIKAERGGEVKAAPMVGVSIPAYRLPPPIWVFGTALDSVPIVEVADASVDAGWAAVYDANPAPADANGYKWFNLPPGPMAADVIASGGTVYAQDEEGRAMAWAHPAEQLTDYGR